MHLRSVYSSYKAIQEPGKAKKEKEEMMIAAYILAGIGVLAILSIGVFLALALRAKVKNLDWMNEE